MLLSGDQISVRVKMGDRFLNLTEIPHYACAVLQGGWVSSHVPYIYLPVSLIQSVSCGSRGYVSNGRSFKGVWKHNKLLVRAGKGNVNRTQLPAEEQETESWALGVKGAEFKENPWRVYCLEQDPTKTKLTILNLKKRNFVKQIKIKKHVQVSRC